MIQNTDVGCITDSGSDFLKTFCLFEITHEEFLGIKPGAENEKED